MAKFPLSLAPSRNGKATSKFAGTSSASKKRNSLSTGARWCDFSYRVVSSEDKDVMLNKLETCITHGIQIRGGNNDDEVLVAGANSVMRLLERDQAAVLIVCRDGATMVTNPLVEAARIRHTAVVVLPSCSHQLAQVLGLKRASCLALRTAGSSVKQNCHDDQENEKLELAMRREAAMDDLRDLLLRLSSSNSSTHSKINKNNNRRKS